MQKWEYRIEELVLGIQFSDDELNDIGENGWELVGIYKEDDSFYAVFKRPKEN